MEATRKGKACTVVMDAQYNVMFNLWQITNGWLNANYISSTAGRIFFVRNPVKLSTRPGAVQRHSHCNRWMDFLHLKFCGIIWTCDWAASCSFALYGLAHGPNAWSNNGLMRNVHLWHDCTRRSLMLTYALSLFFQHGPIGGLSTFWSMGWGVFSFTERLVDIANTLNPVCGVATVCHQIRCMYCEHFSLFHHIGVSRFSWYKWSTYEIYHTHHLD